MANAPDPGHVLSVGLGFWASKVLLSAVELDLFTELGERPRTRAELESMLGLHSRSSRDFLDALVALGFLTREGDDTGARYANTRETAAFLDRRSPMCIGGLLSMANARLYAFWGNLTDALRTGQPQNEIKASGKSAFEAIYADRARLEKFVHAMASVSIGPAQALAEKFDFSRHRTVADVGGADGLLAITLARRHPHLEIVTADLPALEPLATAALERADLADRVRATSLDFFADPLPRADVIILGKVLHDWPLPEKMQLLRAAYAALPAGGTLIAIDAIIDDERRENAFGLLMSLNMLIETPGGFDYSGADFARWCAEVGYSNVEVLPLAGPTSAAIAVK